MSDGPHRRRAARGKLGVRHAVAVAGAAACLASAMVIASNVGARAQDTDFSDTAVALGFRIWSEKIGCNQCHGWNGIGLPDDPRAPVGANLRATQLTPDQMYTIVQCGIPGTQMPAFDARAYIDDRCYGATADDLGDQTPIKRGVYLIPREINAVVAYVFTNIVGRGEITEEECYAYFGEGAAICTTLLAGGAAPAPVANPH
jgi:mono/diheme cytochrome c family protein